VVLDEATVSARHARLDWDGTAAWLTDLGSSNGTRVNSARVTGRQLLADRDALDFGRVKVDFMLMASLRAKLRQGSARDSGR
jgi:pSer/pThr/pTyr-binding forkhead associated (FHA) protein